MRTLSNTYCSTQTLRLKCLIIGYLNLIACIVDIGVHVIVLFIITNGFQCDVGYESLRLINWDWLEPILLTVNIGTHGLYPFPMVLRYQESIPIEYFLSTEEPRCYPSMLHIHMVDVLDFTINVIYLKFVINYLVAVYKKQKDNVQLFFGLSCLKVFLQLMYFLYQPGVHTSFFGESYSCIKLLDILIAFVFLLTMHKFIRQLEKEKVQKDKLPSCIKTLINDVSVKTKTTGVNNKTETVLAIDSEKMTAMAEKLQEKCAL